MKARYALPGLMRRNPENRWSEITSPEDGSLKMLVHSGTSADEVYYVVEKPNCWFGYIKDPKYPFMGYDKPPLIAQYPEYLVFDPTWEEGTINPYDPVIHRWLKDPDAEGYWILTLPKDLLAQGLNKISVSINGYVRHLFVSRPAFNIHNRPDRTLQT